MKNGKENPFFMGAHAFIGEGQQVADEIKITLFENRDSKFPVFYYSTLEENLKLRGVGGKTRLTVKTINPLNTTGEEKEIINLVELQDDFIVFKEVGVIRVGRGKNREMFLTTGKIFRTPYCLTEEDDKFEIDGLNFEPLLAELEKAVRNQYDKGKINPSLEYGEDETLEFDSGLLRGKIERKPIGKKALMVVSTNLLRGYVIAVNSRLKPVLVKMSDLQGNREEAFKDMRIGRRLLAGKIFDIKNDKRARMKATEVKILGGNKKRKQDEEKTQKVKQNAKGKGSKKHGPKAVAETPVKAPAVETVMAAKLRSAGVVKDDLTKINGIGPKGLEKLNKAGILTFSDLAEVKPEQLNGTVKPAWVEAAKEMLVEA